MRHYLHRKLAPIVVLPCGVLARALWRALVNAPGFAHRLASANRGAVSCAVHLSAVAPLADADLEAAAVAVEYAMLEIAAGQITRAADSFWTRVS